MVKILKIEECPTEEIGLRGFSRKIVNKNIGAKTIDLHINILKPNEKGVYHYHERTESIYFPIKGKGKFIVNGEEYLIDNSNVVFIEPGDKHSIMSAGTDEFTMIEIYGSIEKDYININEEE